MATSKSYFATRSHNLFPVSQDRDSTPSLTMDSDSGFEFDESDIYNSGRANSLEFSRSLHGSSSKMVDSGGRAASLPVNIPDWSKILGNEYRENNNNRRRNSIEDEEENEGYDVERSVRLPPHEFLARTRMASFSVHEGVGRTLKGRDLSRVRNAIWAKTGFQD
ncbi:protein S40-4 [Gastrolobium bilobum]|uniref:protein S40-4 n=1 Tax=Gastrolobium bilobum TaxID=150636 RepID=UPI002AB2ED98|nr:protein S40-4 [Gastrolobium bilobum]